MKRPQIVNLELQDMPDSHSRTEEYIERLESELSRYTMSAGMADQYKGEALAARAALGFSADADDVSPSDIRAEILRLQNT